jgi:DNA-binding NarL/FixJ family response regulator
MAKNALNESSHDYHVESIAEKRGEPGILILNSSMQLIFKNSKATELCEQINKVHTGKAASGVLPVSVAEFCSEVLKILLVRNHSKDWEEFRVKRILGDPKRPVLLWAVAIPDQQGAQITQILVMMEAIGRRQQVISLQAEASFNLTERESNVVQGLLKGWTNKEIANELGVLEQTVKEHIRHIMEKTRTTTRTGILVKVLGL